MSNQLTITTSLMRMKWSQFLTEREFKWAVVMLTLWRYGVFVLDRSLVLVLPVILGFSSSSPDNKMWQQAPLDTVFMLDDVDDMLESWEPYLTQCSTSIALGVRKVWNGFNKFLGCPNPFKAARVSASYDDWRKYTVERNKAAKVIRNVKREYFDDAFDTNRNNSKSMWKTIKPLTGITKNAQSVNLSKFLLRSRPREA